jgi:small subunit ribosomal protein S9
MIDDERQDAPEGQEGDSPGTEEPTQPEPEAGAEDTAPEEPAPEEPTPEQPTPEQPTPEQPTPEQEAPAAEQREERPRRERRQRADREDRPEVVPGAHLEPDLVLDEQAGPAEAEFPAYQQDVYEAQPEAAQEEAPEAEAEPEAPSEQPAPRTPLDLAADARYKATGKRKTSVARVILRPGTGTYTINGRPLDEFFPRPTLQKAARQPLETAGYETRMDVVAKIHGGGVSAQAGALRHGVARALVEADPNLRSELKRRGFLTRDARVKERKKAGLKKARKRPQFSKR